MRNISEAVLRRFSNTLLDSIFLATGLRLDSDYFQSVAGGDINRAVRCRDQQGRDWFVKLNEKSCLDMFAAESAGLAELASAGIRVPEVAGFGTDDSEAWLMLEWLDLQRRDDEQLGAALAKLHRHTAPGFGWKRDNYIGRTEQENTFTDSWPEFFRDRRLRVQLELARRHGAPASLLTAGHRLLDRVDDYFAGHEPQPSLLHGDLWGGNKGALIDGTPVLFDPAVYYGDRETDIAMTCLFGGFSQGFYAAYEAEWPLPTGAVERRDLYNLYHVLNHFNLFGGGYRAQAEQMIARLTTRLHG